MRYSMLRRSRGGIDIIDVYRRPHAGNVAADQDDCDLTADEIGCHCGHPIEMTVRPAIFDGDVAERSLFRSGRDLGSSRRA
jgi:hypothetical protein